VGRPQLQCRPDACRFLLIDEFVLQIAKSVSEDLTMLVGSEYSVVELNKKSRHRLATSV
jgi:hypothetical protein